MTFQKATRQQKKARIALHGPSGSGKTYTALELAKGLVGPAGRVAVIDTERGSASLYGDRFEFDVIELDYFSVDNYVKAINEAVDSGYDVLVIDSLSHAWTGLGGVLDSVNNVKGNVFTDGWGKVGTPQQNRLLDSILNAPMHVIATLRVKTDYEVEKDERGKATPKKIGLAPVQRDGVEYEFDIVGSLNIENTLTVEKSRMVDLAGRIIAKPDRKLGIQISNWLNSGAKPEPKVNPDDAPVFRRILDEELARINGWKEQVAKAGEANGDGAAALTRDRAAIIECYKAVKGVATSIDMQGVVQANPATSSMNAQQILDAASAVALACDAVLVREPVF
jgi:ABC-type sugar transport system ATPase subunit